jgi:hypothetical protein
LKAKIRGKVRSFLEGRVIWVSITVDNLPIFKNLFTDPTGFSTGRWVERWAEDHGMLGILCKNRTFMT